MQEITEQVLAEKIGQLSATVETQRALITVLVWKAGRGKSVSIGRGEQRQADALASVEWRRLSSGEIRFTVKTKPEEGTT